MNLSKCLLLSTYIFFLSITPTFSVQASLYTVLAGQTLEISFEIPDSPNEFIESELERTDVFQFVIPVTSPVQDRTYPFNSIDSDVTIELYDGSRRLGRKKTRYTNATFTTRDSDFLDGASSLFSPVHVNFKSFRNRTIDGLIKVKTDTYGSGYQVDTDNILLNLGISSGAGSYSSYWDSKDFITDVDVTGSPTPRGRYAVLIGLDNGIKDMKRYLLSSGWKAENIFSYPSEEYPTFERSWINDVNAKAGDDFLFYYSGHGGTDAKGYDGETHKSGSFKVSSSSETYTFNYSGDEYLVLPNLNLTDDTLTGLFKGNSASGVPWNDIHKTFIIDSCFSGGFWGGDDNDGEGDLESLPLTRSLPLAVRMD